MSVSIEASGLKDFEDALLFAPQAANQAASLALNDVGGGTGLAVLRMDIQDAVNFPAGYVNTDRLGVSQTATPTRLELRIGARQRGTSLARFAAPGTIVGGRNGVQVQVRKGSTKIMRRAFLIRLRAGSSVASDNFNLGLAIRLNKGERVAGSQAAVKLSGRDNVYLLYGPSVDQVLAGVAGKDADQILSMIGVEFGRQFSRLTGFKS